MLLFRKEWKIRINISKFGWLKTNVQLERWLNETIIRLQIQLEIGLFSLLFHSKSYYDVPFLLGHSYRQLWEYIEIDF